MPIPHPRRWLWTRGTKRETQAYHWQYPIMQLLSYRWRPMSTLHRDPQTPIQHPRRRYRTHKTDWLTTGQSKPHNYWVVVFFTENKQPFLPQFKRIVQNLLYFFKDLCQVWPEASFDLLVALKQLDIWPQILCNPVGLNIKTKSKLKYNMASNNQLYKNNETPWNWLGRLQHWLWNIKVWCGRNIKKN